MFRSLDEELSGAGLGDLTTEQGRAEHRSRVMQACMQRLLHIELLAPAEALDVHGQIQRQLRTLNAVGLLSDVMLAGMLSSIDRLTRILLDAHPELEPAADA